VRLSRFLPIALLVIPGQAPAAPVEFKAADRVVLIGGTMIEREQRYGYWEAMLTAKYPGIKVRNLGWSGDDVYGTARRAFEVGDQNIGRKRLVDQTIAEKPSVILIAYGANEAFEGQAGLDKFKKGYEKLLDDLAPTKARFILMSPSPLEHKGPPLPDPTEQNKRLAIYGVAIKEIADARGHAFADLFAVMGNGKEPLKDLTDNGVHFTESGYKQTTSAFARALGLSEDAAYSDNLEPVRQAILKKNELYFHAWRPQNQTYLFGFRKHEQGQNAKEIKEFMPLIAAAEDEIEKRVKK
jgi:lysophospholipase L1-like esterase